MHTFFLILRRALIATQMDGCLGIAKAAAYSGLLCLFPVLTSITTLLAEANAKAVSSRFAQILFDIVPPGTQELILQSLTVTGSRPGLVIVVATFLSVWGASGLMASLMEGFQSAYKLPSGRPIIRQRLVAILLVVGTLAWALVAVWHASPGLRWVVYANIPYLLWGIFATILQITITYLNA